MFEFHYSLFAPFRTGSDSKSASNIQGNIQGTPGGMYSQIQPARKLTESRVNVCDRSTLMHIQENTK